MYKYKPTDRVLFKPSKQSQFIAKVQANSKLSWKQLAKHLNINYRLLTYYRNETYSISYNTLTKLVLVGKIKQPKNIKIVSQYSHNSKAGKKGGDMVYNKYKKIGGNAEYRKSRWKQWWDNQGKNTPNPILQKRKIKIPKQSAELAELFGIIIGDGGITPYQVKITLNSETDREYSKYIIKLINGLFEVSPKIYSVKNSRTINISVSRKNLSDFLLNNGLKIGNKLKQNISIPDWINKSYKFKINCLRGLMDTDGSVVIEKHKINNKNYSYPRVNFTSYSDKLIEQIYQILTELGFNPKFRRSKKSVQLEKIEDICNYFETVGSSNTKHLRRVSQWIIRRSGSSGLRHRS